MSHRNFFWHRAFRPFFLGAAGFAVIAMGIWGSFLSGDWLVKSPGLVNIQPVLWHGHEMIFGYALATVSGFLLTAAMNWSKSDFASGSKLILLVMLWLTVRIGWLFGWNLIGLFALEMTFHLLLWILFALPIIQKRLWQKSGLIGLFLMLGLANALFYSALLNWVAISADKTLLLGLFSLLGINLIMMRRLIPFFTEKALGLTPFKTSKIIDNLAIYGILLLAIAIIFQHNLLISVLALPLSGLYFWRLYHWYHPKIWRQLLLWPLHLSYGFIALGILFYGLSAFNLIPPTLALHSLTSGGIGLLCSAMLARISLGHSGRNVFEPPKGLLWVFVLLVFAAVLRVILPIFWPQMTALWLPLSAFGWALAFSILLGIYWKILLFDHPKNNRVKL